MKTVSKVLTGIAAVALIGSGIGTILGGTMVLAAFGTTVAASTIAVVAGAASMAVNLAIKPPGVPKAQVDRLNATIDPRAFRKTVLGSTAMPVDVRYAEWFGTDQERCGWIVALASHRIDGVDQIWINDELAWSSAGGTSAKYAGYFWVRAIRTEGSATNTVTFGSGKWNANARLTGCAYAWLEFKVTGNGKKAESPFSGGLPSRVTIVGRGSPLYDPRRDSTVAGGAGAMRVGDQSSWRFTADDGSVIGENLPLEILRVLIGWRINGKLAGGCGLPARRLDLQSFIVAANHADELVGRSAGGTEPRYRGAGVLSEGEDPLELLDALCAACNGQFTDRGGKIGLRIAHNDLAAAATDEGLNEDDVIGAFIWNPDPSLETTPTVVRGRYTDPSANSLYQLIDYPEVALASGAEGPFGEVALSMDLAVAESPSQAQRVVSQILQRKQYERSFTAPFDIRAWVYGEGDVVPFTFAPLSFNRRLFRVMKQTRGDYGQCVMTLREESAAIYAWENTDRAPVQAAAPIIYDSRNNPLILAIGQAAETALWSGVSGDGKPQDNATVGAPAGTPVGDRDAAEVLSDIDINVGAILGQIVRLDEYQAAFDARTLVLGQPVSTSFASFRDAQTTQNSAINQALTLLGAKNAGATGWILNLDTVKVSPTQSLAQRFNEIALELDGISGSVTNLSEVVTGANGVTARNLIKTDVNGMITAIVSTSTATESSLKFLAANSGFYHTDGSLLARFQRTNEGDAYIPTLVVDRIIAGSVDTDAIEDYAIAKPYSTELASNVPLPGSGTITVTSLTITKDIGASDVVVEWYMRMRPGVTYAGYFTLDRVVSGTSTPMDTVHYWLPTSGDIGIGYRSVRTVQPYKRRFYSLTSGPITFRLRFTYVGSDGTAEGFIEAGSGLFVEEVKRG